jgi:uncharacterized YigZ family protein
MSSGKPSRDSEAPGSPHREPGASAFRYRVPGQVHRVEEEVRRSRFITTVGPAADEAAARAMVERVREEFPDATHHCWAFVAGPPGSTARVGMSDDGEPHGTAGRPMLQALLHGDVGEIAAVVTRYYGGVRLGKGGLGRAYAGGVQRALATLPLRERVEWVHLRIQVGYPGVDPLRRLLEASQGVIRGEAWGDDATLEVALPSDREEAFCRGLADATAGSARISRLRPRPRREADD